MGFTGKFDGMRIAAVASAVSDNVVRNDVYLPVLGEEALGKFEKMTGVLERRHAVQLTTRRLAVAAALALRDAGAWQGEDVDACLFVSQTPDYRLPATACVIHGELGLRPDCVAMDIGLGCSGFVYGMYVAASLLRGGGCRKVLLVGGDCISKIVAAGDAANKLLFGDAGFAAIVERDEVTGQEVPFLLGTDGAGCDAIFSGGDMGVESIWNVPVPDPYLHMDGPAVFDFTISRVPQAIQDFCNASGRELGSFDHFAFHQANKFILKQIAMLTGFPNSKHLLSIDKYGNTSSASIPLTLCANCGNLGGMTMMAGFGVGLSWGILSYDFSGTKCLDVITVKEKK